MKKYLLILFLSFCTRSEAQNWKLLWSDEFDSGNINTKNWTFDLGASGWGNNELEYYTKRPENAATINGNLLIIAKKESFEGSSYTSARMKTQELQSFTYGKVEARIKLPVGQGLWPAFWMLGNSISQVGWPKCGEIDIMEHINNTTEIVGTMHWDNNGHVMAGKSTPCTVPQYHVYAIEWDAKAIKWFLDGNKFYEGNIGNNVNSTEEFHLPHFVILNLAVGGNWPGNPNSTTPFPDTMYVDYVRVYQPSSDVGSNDSEPIPDRFALGQNYPNPFNPNTVIDYQLPATSHVLLEVYDTLGKEVATLVNEEKAPGTYEIEFDGNEINSGVYFYRMIADNFEQTKKFLLLR